MTRLMLIGLLLPMVLLLMAWRIDAWMPDAARL